jgi:predicted GNAT family N-acyltransferase
MINSKVEIFSADNKSLLSISQSIRRQVFVVEQEIDEKLEIDNHDKESNHVLLFQNRVPIGTARYRETEKGYKLERFAVLKEYRSSGVGEKMLNAILLKIIPERKPVYLNSQDSAVNFYLKNNFNIKGECFFEAGVKHWCMYFNNSER